MNEATVKRLLRDLADALEALGRDLVPARRRLRDLENDGYRPGGMPEGSLGGGRHGDPTASAVLGTALIERGKPVSEARQFGYRTRDEFEQHRHRLERDLARLVAKAQDLAVDAAEILRTGRRTADVDTAKAGIVACELCDTARYPGGDSDHACSDECKAHDHRPANRYQPRHSISAPRTPARVHACTPPRLAVLVDGRTVPLTPPTRDVVYTLVDHGDTIAIIASDYVPAGTRGLCRVRLPAGAPCVFETDLEHLKAVPDRPRCSWHYDFAERYGVDAANALTLWHLEHPGLPVPDRLVREHHPAEYARHQARARGAS